MHVCVRARVRIYACMRRTENTSEPREDWKPKRGTKERKEELKERRGKELIRRVTRMTIITIIITRKHKPCFFFFFLQAECELEQG